MPQTPTLPFLNPFDYLRSHRIVRHIDEGFQEFSHTVNDFREKPFSPDMAADKVVPVPRHGEHAQYPLHDTRQGFAPFWAYDEMDVVAHDAKIMDLEAELLFCPLDSVEEERSHGLAIEDHLFPVSPRGDVVSGIGLENSISPHIGVYGNGVKNALVDLVFLLKC
jgi:hypothetical protein